MRNRIYLCGPVEMSDDPKNWRDKVKEEFGYYNFVDPTEFGWEPGENDHEMINKCFREVKLSDGVLINWNVEEPTWGSPVEQHICYQHGIPNVVWSNKKEEELPITMKVFMDGMHYSLDKVLAMLENVDSMDVHEKPSGDGQQTSVESWVAQEKINEMNKRFK